MTRGFIGAEGDFPIIALTDRPRRGFAPFARIVAQEFTSVRAASRPHACNLDPGLGLDFESPISSRDQRRGRQMAELGNEHIGQAIRCGRPSPACRVFGTYRQQWNYGADRALQPILLRSLS